MSGSSAGTSDEHSTPLPPPRLNGKANDAATTAVSTNILADIRAVLTATPRSAHAIRTAYAAAVKSANPAPDMTRRPAFGIVITLLLVIMSVFHTLYLKLILHELPSHAFFVTQWSTVVYAVLISAVAAVRYWIDPSVYTPAMRAFPTRYFGYIAVLCAIADLLFTIGASEVPGSLLNMLRQISIPLTVALSYRLLHVRFNKHHFWACALIIGSVALSFFVNYSRMDWELTTPHIAHHRHPSRAEQDAAARAAELADMAAEAAEAGFTLPVSLLASVPPVAPHVPTPPPGAPLLPVLESHSHTNTQLFIYGSIFLSSLIPGSILLVAKEYVYKVWDMDVVYLSAWVSSIQVVVSFLLVPIAVVADVEGPSLRQLPHNFYTGLQCLFDASANVQFVCPANVGQTMAVYNVLTFCRYLLTLVLLKYGGSSASVLVFLSASLSLPLTNLCFGSKTLMGTFAESPKHAQYMCSLIAFFGLLAYAYAEKQKLIENKAAEAMAAATEALLRPDDPKAGAINGNEHRIRLAADGSTDADAETSTGNGHTAIETNPAVDAAVDALAAAVGGGDEHTSTDGATAASSGKSKSAEKPLQSVASSA